MLSLRNSTGSITLDKILSKPFTIIEYENAPEVVNSRYFPDSSPHLPEHYAQELGFTPQKHSYKSINWNYMPDAYIHEMENVFMYNGILHSKNGSVFVDNFRVYDSTKKIQDEYGPAAQSPIIKINDQYRLHRHTRSNTKITTYKDTVVPFFNLYTPYGHWILEAISTLWAQQYTDNVKYLLSYKVTLPKYFENLLLPFGLTRDNFIIPSDNILLERIFLPSKAYMHCSGYISNLAKAVWRKMADFYCLNSKESNTPKKIYISRKFCNNRKLVNEQECEDVFKKHGFDIVYPETLDISKQICLFANATHVAGPIGSGMHNTIFSLNPKQLKEMFLSSDDSFIWGSRYSFISNNLGRMPYFIFGKGIEGSHSQVSHRSFSINPKELELAIKQWLED